MWFNRLLGEKFSTDLEMKIKKLFFGVCHEIGWIISNIKRPNIIPEFVVIHKAASGKNFIQTHKNTFHFRQATAHIDLSFRRVEINVLYTMLIVLPPIKWDV